MESDKENRKTLKCALKTILDPNVNYTKFYDCIERANKAQFVCYHFIRHYVLHEFNAGRDIPVLDHDFIMMAFKAISKATAGPKSKNENGLIYNELCNFYNNHFIDVFYKKVNNININVNDYKCNSKNLSYIFNSLAIQMKTAYSNNIQMNFLKYVNQYVNQHFINSKLKKLTRDEFKKLDKMEREIYIINKRKEGKRIKSIKEELYYVKNDLLNNTLKSDKKYHAWIDKSKKIIFPDKTKNTLTIEDDIKVSSHKYLKHMLIMSKDLMEKNKKSFQPICLRTSVTDKYIPIDTSTIRDIFKGVGSGKTHDEMWKENFNINFNKFKLKNHTFNHSISTDGFSVSIIFIPNNLVEQKVNKSKAMTSASKKSKQNKTRISKADRDELELKKKLVAREMARKLREQKKEEYKKMSKEEQEETKRKIKIEKNKYEYIEDAVEDPKTYEELKKAYDKGKIKVVDPGQRSLMTILGTGNKSNLCRQRKEFVLFDYSNRKRLKETKRLEHIRSIDNRKKKTNLKNNISIKDIEKKISFYSAKTMDIDNFKRFTKLKLEMKDLVSKESAYNKYVIKLRWKRYVNTRSHEDRILDDLEQTYGSDAIFVIGDWSNKGKTKYISTPNLRIKKLLSKRFKVYLIDEYNTSKLYHKTGEEGKNLIMKFKYTKNGEEKVMKREMHSLLMFKTSEKEQECINRDYNATLNMIKLVNNLMLNKKRPEIFCRGKKKITIIEDEKEDKKEDKKRKKSKKSKKSKKEKTIIVKKIAIKDEEGLIALVYD